MSSYYFDNINDDDEDDSEVRDKDKIEKDIKYILKIWKKEIRERNSVESRK